MRNRAYLKSRFIFKDNKRAKEEAQALVSNMPASMSPHDILEKESSRDFYEADYQPRFQLTEVSEHTQDKIPTTQVSFYYKFKRLMDIVVSVIALLVFLCLLPFIALAIKLDSPGPVFFKQERVGINRRRISRSGFMGTDRRKVLQPGRPFQIYKLRSMRIDAEKEGPRWASKDDPRVTRVGHYLRKTRLDEIPQFINVMRGDMSLIGPRPERLCFIRQLEKTVPYYRERLLVRPGITGLAQVRNGYDSCTDSVKRKVELDRLYIQKPSVVNDLRIILSTVRVVITGDGSC